MQTFLPYTDFTESARTLDRQRLGKQRVECIQILKALSGETEWWVNHPVTRSWEGHERALCAYGIEVCREWKRRGYKDTCEEKIGGFVARFPPESAAIPSWLDDAFADKHKGILFRKNPTFYHSFYGYA